MSLERIKYLMYKDLNLLKERHEFPPISNNLFNLRGETPNSERNMDGKKVMSGDQAGQLDGHILHSMDKLSDAQAKLNQRNGLIGADDGGRGNGKMFDGPDFDLICSTVSNQNEVVQFFNCLAAVEKIYNNNQWMKHKDIRIKKDSIYIKLIKLSSIFRTTGTTTYKTDNKEYELQFKSDNSDCKLLTVKLNYMDKINDKNNIYRELKTTNCFNNLIQSINESTNLITFK